MEVPILTQAREMYEDEIEVFIDQHGKNVVCIPADRYEQLIDSENYRSFYEQIDWVRLGKRLEYELNYDGTGWERLGRAWRSNDPDGVIAHVYKAFNKDGNYSSILDKEVELPKEHVDILATLVNRSYMFQQYGEEK